MRSIKNITCLIGTRGGLCHPSGLYYDIDEGLLYICDMGNSRIGMFCRRTGILEFPAHMTQEKSRIMKPLALTLDNKKRLLVTDALDNCIHIYENGGFKTAMADMKMNLPGSITSDFYGNIFVSDFHYNRVIKWDGRLPAHVLEGVDGIKIYGIYFHNGWLYYTDGEHGKICRFHIATQIKEIISCETERPISVSVSPKGDVYFSERKRLCCCRTNGTMETLISGEICNRLGLEKPRHIGSIAIESEECFFFADTINNCVYEVQLKENGFAYDKGAQ